MERLDIRWRRHPAYLPGLLLHRITILILITLATFLSIPRVIYGTTAEIPRVPNIVLILADDMGYSDIGCYGSEINTPVLDGLAAGGLRFTHFYNTARCCPTRASLLTGLYPHQAGVGHMTADRGYDGYRGDLNNRCVTIAEVLKTAGYSTYISGKWHVTKGTAPEGPKDNWPLQRGFDKFYGTITGAGSFYDPSLLTRDNTMISPFNDPEYAPARFYYSHAISDNAVKYIDAHKAENAGKPFFMYVAYTAAHWPMHALEEDVARYKGKYDGGYEPIRKARFERMKKLGVIEDHWELSPQAGDWDAVENKDWEARCMEVYAAMIDSMDQGIGRITAALDRNGMADNTLVFFLQDNGGCAETLGRKAKGQYTARPDSPPFDPRPNDLIQLDMIPKQTRDGYPVIQGPGEMPGPEGTYIAYGQGWANVSDTPFREYKHWVHEGGISTPLIAHWPARIKRTGQLEHQPGHLVDLMATCVDVSGATYPSSYKDQDVKPLEGRSLAPAFNGRRIDREALYWEHEGNRAVRIGKWKLVAKGADGPWELYDTEADRSEMHDLAQAEPERTRRMAAVWQAYAERANVLPLNPKGGKKSSADFSKKKTFTLALGDDLDRTAAPHAVDRSVTITATIDAKTPDGVILAQGGSVHGYSLYLTGGKLAFAVRHEGKLSTVVADEALPTGPIAVSATLAKDGTVTLTADGNQIASAKTPGPLADMPGEGLQIGRDLAGSVGEYDSTNPFAGIIEKVTVKLAD